MRNSTLVLVPLLAAMAAEPAAAQVRASIQVGPVHVGVSDRRHEPRHIAVIDYSPRYGNWRSTARHWRPVTVYYVGGRYYRQPYRNARPVVIYRYQGRYFNAPRDRDWNNQRSRYERNEWRQWRDDRGNWRRDDDDRRNGRGDDRRGGRRRG